MWSFEYYKPKRIEEVADILSKKTKILAGGTDLLVNIRNGIYQPEAVIDIKGIKELGEYNLTRNGTSFIGASVIINRLIEDSNCCWSAMRQSLVSIATNQVRNRATIIGNLCNASPAADSSLPLLVLNSKVKIQTSDGSSYLMPLESFFGGPKKSVLKEKEWVTGVEIPCHPESIKTIFLKKQRIKGHDLAIVNMAGYCNLEEKKLRIAVGSSAPTPILFNFDQMYANTPKKDMFPEVLKSILAKIKPISDNRGSAEYRIDIIKYFVDRTLQSIL